ncbi:MAG: prolipoprotein diacylglyceryl transferase [Bryobacterales bacterium]|nr:prolipoprotein diacylglyceryl transferase [Bryobacterales bacterium]
MIPYVTWPPLIWGGWIVPPFALLVSIGVLVAHLILMRRARGLGLHPAAWAGEFSLAAVVAGFAGAVAFKFLYRPELWLGEWPFVLAWPGISSFGGLFGGLAGALAYLSLRRADARHRGLYFDALGFAFPFGLWWGRLGCSVTHDHPGRLAAQPNLFTVAYPDGPRYDLGVLETLFLTAVCAAFLLLRGRRPGFFFAAFLLLYGPFRIALDTLHVDPPRYAGLAVDQWAGAAVFLTGVAVWQRARRSSTA